MSTGPETARAVVAPGAVARSPAALGRADAPALTRRLAARLGREWLPRAAWTVGRTGRSGLVGIALLAAAVLFLFSTHLTVTAEVEELRAGLAAAQGQAGTVAVVEVADPAAATRALPARTGMPAILGQIFDNAAQARLALDTAKYEVHALGSGAVVRYQLAFQVSAPYPQIRAFIDATLATMPAVALSGLVIERKSISHGNVEAEIRMDVYTRSTP